MTSMATTTIAILHVLGALITPARGHGYMSTPKSRNWHAYQNTNWASSSSNDPQPESCPQCLNKGGVLARCGIAGDRNYDEPKSAAGGPLRPKIQAEYSQGQEITVEVVLTAHHKGHFVFSACPISPGEAATQACFDRYQLEFVEDLAWGAAKDRNHPERAYVAPLPEREDEKEGRAASGGVEGLAVAEYAFRMKLPDDLHGELVLLQWYYLTANSCIHPGYKEYDWPRDWDYDLSAGACGKVSDDGSGVPEQFWNCAEVRINRKGRGGSGGSSGGGQYNGRLPQDESNGRPNKPGRKPGRTPGKKKPSTGKKKPPGRQPGRNNGNTSNKPGKKKKPAKKKPGKKKKRRVDQHPRRGRIRPRTGAEEATVRKKYLRENIS